MANWSLRDAEPYQILFPIGAAHSVVGAGAFVLHALGLSPYPFELHAHHMLAGFLLSFVTGFLMTAVPSFTGTKRRTGSELTVATALSVAAIATTSFVPAFLTICLLLAFFLARVSARSATPPPHFIFIPIGLSLGLIGSALMSLGQLGLVPPGPYLGAARIMFFHSMILMLLLGIGSRLIPALLGWAPVPRHRAAPTHAPSRREPRSSVTGHEPFLQAALLIAGLALEILNHPQLGRSVEALCASWMGLKYWRIHRLPKARSRLAQAIWASAWVLLAGLWVSAGFPALGVHGAHLVFIGGFGLMTLLVASRVTLAHGGHDLSLEAKSRIYVAFSLLAVLAALTRLSAIWTPSYIAHLGYAAALWIAAVVSWAAFFVPKMLNLGSSP